MKSLVNIVLSGVLMAGLAAVSGASLAGPPALAGVKAAAAPAVTAPTDPATGSVLNRALNARNGVTGYSSSSPRILALTPNECKGLGGKVVATTECKSGSICTTADRSGVIHKACIDDVDPG